MRIYWKSVRTESQIHPVWWRSYLALDVGRNTKKMVQIAVVAEEYVLAGGPYELARALMENLGTTIALGLRHHESTERLLRGSYAFDIRQSWRRTWRALDRLVAQDQQGKGRTSRLDDFIAAYRWSNGAVSTRVAHTLALDFCAFFSVRVTVPDGIWSSAAELRIED